MTTSMPAADYSTLPTKWIEALPAQFDVDALHAAVGHLYGNGQPSITPSHRTDVFRAFHLTPLASVRVVILGEDPYPDASQAHGLAFSVSSTSNAGRPQSLGRIFGALRQDLQIRPSTNDLSTWARRGVLLLNVALTHQAGATKPDLETWGHFTRTVLSVISAKQDPVAWLLWGEFAIGLADSVPVDNPDHRRFENAHPRAGRAKRLRLRQDPPFAKASAFLGTAPDRDWAI